ncbi:MAG: hypothetical protein V4508_02405 [Pseudomonadota bacterium]
MKNFSIVLVMLLAGCATRQDQWRQDIGLSPIEQERQSTANTQMIAAGLALMQANQPHTLAQPAAAPASPIPGMLQTQTVNGFLRYCRYSNGVITTIASTTLCPMNTQ